MPSHKGKLTKVQCAAAYDRAQTRHDELYAMLLPAATRAVHAYVAACRQALAQQAQPTIRSRPAQLTAAGPIAAPGDGSGQFGQDQLTGMMQVIDGTATSWPSIMQKTLSPALIAVLNAIPDTEDDGGLGLLDDPNVQSAIEGWRASWLEDRTQELVGVPDEIAAELRTELTNLAEREGTSVWDAQQAVQGMLDQGYPSWTSRAELIARTETVSANNQGMLAAWQAMFDAGGLTGTKTWIGGTRPTHDAVNGTSVGIGDMFVVGGMEMNGPGDSNGGPSEVCNCVTGDTRVQMPGLRAVMRRWYEGNVVALRTARGHQLTVTPNHPVLGGTGRWVAAGALRVGDHVVSGSIGRWATGEPDVQGGPAEIAEVYRAAKLVTGSKRVATRVPDFHGDGAEGHVEVVAIDRSLFVGDDAASPEQVEQFGLAFAALAATALRRDESGTATVGAPSRVTFDRIGAATGSIRGPRQLAPVHSRESAHTEHGGVMTAARLDTGSDQPAADGGSADTERAGQGQLGLACDVTLDEIVHVERLPYAGHVYNLDTGDGWYMGNSLATANCRCSMSFEVDDTPAGQGGDTGSTSSDQAGDGEGDAMTAAGVTGQNTGVAIMAHLNGDQATERMVEGGESAGDMHVTLGYLAEPAADVPPEARAALELALTDALGPMMPISGNAFGIAQLNPDDAEREPCMVLLVQSDQLAQAHDAVMQALDDTDGVSMSQTFPIWVPHVTVGYNIDPGSVTPEHLGGLSFDRLIIGWGDEQHQILPGETLSDGPSQTGTDEQLDDDEADGEMAVHRAGEHAVTAPTDAPDSPPPADGPPVPDAAGPADPTDPVESAGPTWSGPLAELGLPGSSDGRVVQPDGGVIRPLPLPLSWQEASGMGHDGSVVIGRILAVENRGDVLWGHGDYLGTVNEDVLKAMAQVDAGLGFVSVDLAPLEGSLIDSQGNPVDPIASGIDEDDVKLSLDRWEFAGATIVGFPAFATARIANDQPTETSDATVGGPILMPGEVQTFAGMNPEAPVISDDGTSITLTDGTTVEVGAEVSIPDVSGAGGGADTGTIISINADEQTVTVKVNPDDDGDADDDPDNPQTVDVPVADLLPASGDQRPTPEQQDASKPKAGPPPAKQPPPAVAPPAAGQHALEVVDGDRDMALLASSYREPYRAEFFAQRKLLGPTPLTINDETGEVYGHFATYGECHVGKLAETGNCVTMPLGCDYDSYFHLRPVETVTASGEGGEAMVGLITVGTGHADRRHGMRGAVEHYDHTGTQVAVIRAYDDEWGGQFSGQLIHGVDPAKVEELRLSGQLSGDWRTNGARNGQLQLVAALAVNVPGFAQRRGPAWGMDPTGERQISLVAAAMVYPDEHPDVILPSGKTMPRDDWMALVNVAMDAVDMRARRQQAFTLAKDSAVRRLAQIDAVELAKQRAQVRLRMLATID